MPPLLADEQWGLSEQHHMQAKGSRIFGLSILSIGEEDTVFQLLS